jgi:hypothetical protein
MLKHFTINMFEFASSIKNEEEPFNLRTHTRQEILDDRG